MNRLRSHDRQSQEEKSRILSATKNHSNVQIAETVTSAAEPKTAHTRRERYHLSNSLTCALKSLEGVRITIDLRNEHALSGVVTHVDGFMNIDFHDVRYYSDPVYESKQFVCFEKFLVRNRQIRYVHLPKDFNVTVAIQAVLRRMFGRPDKLTGQRQCSRKALASHLQTLRDLNQKERK